MHMADALLSPAVGATMWAVTATAIFGCSRRLRTQLDDRKIPLMGVLGAFIFAAQMINFTIPGTGSSGHLGGGMILAILLGPCAAFLTLASVLTVQALFFADGGLLALGSNIFNLGVFPCFIAYPLIYKKIVGRTPTAGRITAGAIVAAVCGLQLGSLGVVLETVLSGVAELPFGAFVLMMQPIHLAIGLVEGVVTAIVVCFLLKARPEVLASAVDGRAIGGVPMKKVLITLGLVSVLTAGVFSWFVSSHPDGLEWAIEKVTGGGDLEAPDQGVHPVLAELQERVAVLPDYGFRADGQGTTGDAGEGDMGQAGTTVAGLVGGLLTLGFAVLAGWLLRRFSRKA